MESEAASTMWDILWQNLVEQVGPPTYSTNFGPLSPQRSEIGRSFAPSVGVVRPSVER